MANCQWKGIKKRRKIKVSDFISEKKIGYTCNYTAKDIEKQLLFILDNKTDLVLLREQVKQIALEHTWEKRCLTVIESLHS